MHSHKGLDTRQHALSPCTSFNNMYLGLTKPKQELEYQADLTLSVKNILAGTT